MDQVDSRIIVEQWSTRCTCSCRYCRRVPWRRSTPGHLQTTLFTVRNDNKNAQSLKQSKQTNLGTKEE